MRLHGRRMDVELPWGLRGPGDGPRRRATLAPLDGAAELLAADEPNPFLAAHSLLARCLLRLGSRTEPSLDDVRLLSPIDRDFLLIQLDRLSFGELRYQTMRCPVPECQTRIDIEIDLSTVVAPEPPPRVERELALGDGRAVRLRLPAAGDQEALYDVPESARAAALVDRCRTDAGAQLGARELVACALAIGEANPRLDLSLALTCPRCGASFGHEYEPVRGLLGRLRRGRAELLAEVHVLALHYHWPHREILELSRGLRREYLQLLERDFSGKRGLA